MKYLFDDYDANMVRNLARSIRNEIVYVSEPQDPDEAALKAYDKRLAHILCGICDVITSAMYGRGYTEDEIWAGFRRMLAVRNRDHLYPEEVKAVFNYLWTTEPANV